MSIIGDRICQLRVRRGMSQTELAEAIGESKQTIYKYEHGIVTNIPIAKVEAIAKVLKCPPSALTGWENSQREPDPDDLTEELQMLRDNPETRTLLKSSKGLTADQLAAVTALMKQMRGSD